MPRLITEILRVPRSRGFGVQSPNDYKFLRQVIRRKVGLDSLDNKLIDEITHCKKSSKKKLLFYLRLTHFLDNKHIVIIRNKEQKDITDKQRTLFLLSGNKDANFCFADDINVLKEGDVAIVEDMEQWQQLAATDLARITFDMKITGVAFCDKKRYKMNYNVLLL